MFQSTHPCGVRPAAAIVYAVLEQTFQSTHPCGVRLIVGSLTVRSSNVSIHAPLRGATSSPSAQARGCAGFNPRTPAGCDIDGEAPSWSGLSFNPRTPAGCDHCDAMPVAVVADVSIHAPLRGATRQPSPGGPGTRFQSTHPCGVRRYRRQGSV